MRKNNARKYTIRICIGIGVLINVSCMPCFAQDITIKKISNIRNYAESSERKEEKVWKFRIYNGVRQKRLWSITYRCWLTDWINC